jgi:acyl carrier protein
MEMGILYSTGFLELIAHIEGTYGITVMDEEMIPENLDSLNSLVAFLSRKCAA